MTLLLDSEAVLAQGLAELAARDPGIAAMLALAQPRLRKREPGFEGLAAIIVSQQVSTASAAAIWRRVTEKFPAICHGDILASGDADLQSCGLSRPKIRTLRAVSEAIASGNVPLEALADLPADEAHRLLVTIKGIGPWTADIYLLFCLGHPDAFPAGDLALQEGVRMAYALETRPDAKTLADFAERWRPWRGVAAKLIWAYYGAVKSGGNAGMPGAVLGASAES
jgi:DNA-3-methyladenine glycosylase II